MAGGCERAADICWRFGHGGARRSLLRQDFTLEETRPAKHQGDKWVWIVVSLVWIFAITQTCLEMGAR